MFDHRAVMDGEYAAECRVCGESLVDVGLPTMRHRGEPMRRVEPKIADRLAFTKAVAVAERAVDKVSDDPDPAQIARNIVERLYETGFIRRNPRPPR